MYTGIVRAIGTVVRSDATSAGRRIVLDPGGFDYAPEAGDSVGCSGCCLTLVEKTADGWVFDAMHETLRKTTLGEWAEGTRVNLERPLRMGDGLDGHQVQGHVDGVGEVMGIDESDGWRIRVGVPEGLRSSMIPKGSVTIDGVSLTLAAVAEDGSWIECAIIPETLKRTTISERVKGDRVNLEGDVLVKAIVATMARMGVGSR
jgi:riboflavin synthase